MPNTHAPPSPLPHSNPFSSQGCSPSFWSHYAGPGKRPKKDSHPSSPVRGVSPPPRTGKYKALQASRRPRPARSGSQGGWEPQQQRGPTNPHCERVCARATPQLQSLGPHSQHPTDCFSFKGGEGSREKEGCSLSPGRHLQKAGSGVPTWDVLITPRGAGFTRHLHLETGSRRGQRSLFPALLPARSHLQKPAHTQVLVLGQLRSEPPKRTRKAARAGTGKALQGLKDLVAGQSWGAPAAESGRVPPADPSTPSVSRRPLKLQPETLLRSPRKPHGRGRSRSTL